MLFQGHGAANVTLGIPRLREIVMTASQKPKTPSMSMEVRPGVSDKDIDIFCKRASRVTLAQVVENVTVRERLTVEGEARRTQFTIDLSLYPKKEYLSEYDIEPLEILACFTTKFPLTLKKEMQNEMKKLDADLKSQIRELGQGKKQKPRAGEQAEADDDGDEPTSSKSKKKDDDDESEAGDGDADNEKRARQKKQQATYDDDEEDEEDEDEPLNDDDIEAAYASDAPEVPKKKLKSLSTAKRVSAVADAFTRNLQHATSFSFDESKCTFQLQVSFLNRVFLSSADVSDLFSSVQICPSSCWLAFSNEHVVPRSFVRYRVSPNVSRLGKRARPKSRLGFQPFAWFEYS
jgi:DNA-directed RNA polymerase I subunit RPA1